jgi:hypothetical protein
MRIDNRFAQPVPDPIERPQTPSGEARRSDEATKVTLETQSYVPASEIPAVLEQVDLEPELRPEVLKKVAQRLADGNYLTRKAAEATAAAILGNQ